MATPDDDVPTAFRDGSDSPTLVAAPPPSAGRFTPGTILGNRYRIIAMLGRGGMGEVYRADDLRLGQQVALKFLPRGVGTDADRARLVQEVRIGRDISHPNVCRLYDIVDLDGQLFIAMEYVDGEDLASLLRRIGRLPTDKALAVARDLCAGLAAAHEKGVIHRDLKPANVMIDGRGRARITDFGLAVAGDADRATSSAGTPAYMAPEQLAGGLASIKSDVYALGLVLFEVFTGRRAIEGNSLSEISERQKNLRDVSLSRLAPGIDPTIEKTIRWCLASEPEDRPAAADEVTRALPERDPLAAALAAGETPSPALVADAGKVGDLPHGSAWSLLSMAIVGIVAIALLSERTMLYHLVDLPKPPDALRDRAKEIARFVAPDARVVDEASRMSSDDLRLDEGRDWPLGAPPNPFLFACRQSPRPLKAANWQRLVLWDDPPHDASGMTSVLLDAEGRLMKLVVVPPERENVPSSSDYDWRGLLGMTGLDLASLRPDTPLWAAPVDTDSKKAWRARYPGGHHDVRVEAASFHGRPIFFSVILPWDKPARMEEQRVAPMMRIAEGVLIFHLIALPIAALFLARRNLLRGQGDRRGATVIGVVVFAAYLTAMLLRADHSTMFLVEAAMITQLLANAVLWGALAWLIYIAAEPFIRRRWPEMLISWSRLIAGRLRDPMVGRDLLIGVATGIGLVVVSHVLAVAEWRWVPTTISPLKATTPLGPVRQIGFFLVRGFAEALMRGLFVALILVLMRGFLRRTWLAVIVVMLLGVVGSLDLGLGSIAARTIFGLIASVACILLVMRYGLLAVCTAAYAALLLIWLPITLDPGSWFFGRSLILIATLAALAGFGFIVSLGSKPLFPRAIFEE